MRRVTLHYPEPLTVDQVRARVVREGEVLLEYFWGTDALHLFVIDRTDVYPLTLPVTQPVLAQTLEQWRQPFEDAREAQEAQTRAAILQRFDLARAHSLYQQLVQPAMRYVPAGATLVIVPDGVLHYLPFDLLVTHPPALSTRPQAQATQYRDAAYLGRQHPIVYAPSASVLHPDLLFPAPRQAPPKTLLAMAPFAQRTQGDKFLAWLKSGVLAMSPLRQSAATGTARRLRQSGHEVAALQEWFPTDTTVLFDEQATKAAFLAQGKQYRYLHFATHGYLNMEHPLQSSIDFADFPLSAEEIFNLDLQADLVVLSACETALGEVQPGEGLVGLTRAFLYAGTPTVIASLWRVDDALTARLMTDFYRRLQAGAPKGQALQQAKVAAMQQHPFYWAPWVLVGDWR